MPRDIATALRRPITGATVLIGDDQSAGTKNIFLIFRDEGETQVVALSAPSSSMMVGLLDEAGSRQLIEHMRKAGLAGDGNEFVDEFERALDARRTH